LIRQTTAGVELDVRVIPRAKRTEAAGLRNGALLVRLAAPPVDGAANTALVAFLASTLGVPSRAVQLLSGERGRQKRILIAGAVVAQVESALLR
jgi:uncharacterized protein (TIGR00251 family)